MQQPKNYDNTKAAGEYTPVELGSHILVIKQVKEMMSKTNKPMLVVYFDFAQNDKQAGYFAEEFKNDIRPDKKWPNAATQYILTEDQDGNCSKNLKGFTTSVEKSNPGFNTYWEPANSTPETKAKFVNQFKGKLVGGVFGIVKDYYEGRELTKRELRWFRSVDKLTDDIPAETTTKQWKEAMEKQNREQNGDPDFMNIPDGIDEELPFN